MTDPPEAARAGRVSPWLGLLLVASLWIVARPYLGLAHDGILYLGQALLHIRPDVMSQDIFFAHGSQDRFSIFARLLALAYERAELPLVQMTVMATCLAALLGATWLLLAPLDHRERWLGLCALAVLSHQYGGHAVFAFGERFVSARTLAEPLALLVLAALLRSRLALAVGAWLGCALVHPLVAVSAAIVAWCVLVFTDRRWLWALLLLAPVLVAAAFGVKPFDGLLASFDEGWWSSVQRVVRHVLISSWGAVDFVILALDSLLLALVAWRGPVPLRRLCAATLAAVVLASAVSLVGADLMRNVLITQLQLWRVQWIGHLLALALLPAVFLQVWREPQGRAIALALAAAAVTAYSRWPLSWAFLAWLVLLCALRTRPRAVRPAMNRALTVFGALMLVAVSLAVLASNHGMILDLSGRVTAIDVALLLVTTPLLSLALAWSAIVCVPRKRALAVPFVLCAGALLAWGATNWDRRGDMVRAIEDGLHRDHPFRAHVPRGAQVLWWEFPAASWVLLQRANYWSVPQGAGLLFNRATAEAFKARNEVVAALNMQAEVCRALSALNDWDSSAMSECTPTIPVLQRICRVPDAPDHLVFQRRLDGALAEWSAPTVHERPKTWYLYACTDFR